MLMIFHETSTALSPQKRYRKHKHACIKISQLLLSLFFFYWISGLHSGPSCSCPCILLFHDKMLFGVLRWNHLQSIIRNWVFTSWEDGCPCWISIHGLSFTTSEHCCPNLFCYNWLGIHNFAGRAFVYGSHEAFKSKRPSDMEWICGWHTDIAREREREKQRQR